MTNFDEMTTMVDDASLVAKSLAGDREAFQGIVLRYQSLICSLAYSASGSLSQSEDVAQETFLVAWKQLGTLREPARLRSWLCKIARNLISDALRSTRREPSAQGELLDEMQDPPATEPSPSEALSRQEEEALLWSALERIPEIYREPLVLFYREQQSVAAVAAALELSEDAVKQRLSRGRKLLQEAVAAFVAGALQRTGPGRLFTLAVMGALPVMTASASAATVGILAAKTATAGKTAGTMALSGSLLGPLIGLLGSWIGIKASLANASSEKERRMIIQFAWMSVAFVLVSLAVMGTIVGFAKEIGHFSPLALVSALIVFAVLYMGLLFGMIHRFNAIERRVRAEVLASGEGRPAKPGHWKMAKPFVHRSARSLLGLPLIDVRLGRHEGESKPALGWIAVGDKAVGILFAAGGIAIGGISMGGFSIGLISVAGAAVGVWAAGGLAIGVWALGGIACGYYALGGAALAWKAALGGVAVASEVALGGIAQADHANDAVARNFIDAHPFFVHGMKAAMNSKWLMFLWVLPIAFTIFARKKGLTVHTQDQGSKEECRRRNFRH